MNFNFDITTISGATQLIAASGGEWPSFHDAEVIALFLSREEQSWLKIHTWKILKQVDTNGFLVLSNHLMVTFRFDNVHDIELSGFNRQNVIAGLVLKREQDLTELSLLGCFGLCGTISAGAVSIEFEKKAEVHD